MLKINVNKERELRFEIEIGGVDYTQVKSQLKIVINEVEYGFPARVERDKITVQLPPLRKVVASRIKEGDEADIKLEMIAETEYLTPWQDKVILSNPLVVEAKIIDSGFQDNPSLETKLVVAEHGAKQTTTRETKELKSLTEDDLIDKVVNKLSKKLGEQDAKHEKEETPEEEAKEEKAKEQPETESEALERLLNKSINAFKLNEKEGKRTITLDEFKKKLSTKHIMEYIKKKGSSNSEVQSIIYEQAKLNAKSATPVNILKEVMIILKKKK